MGYFDDTLYGSILLSLLLIVVFTYYKIAHSFSNGLSMEINVYIVSIKSNEMNCMYKLNRKKLCNFPVYV